MLDRNLRVFGHVWINFTLVGVTAAVILSPDALPPAHAAAVVIAVLFAPGATTLALAERFRGGRLKRTTQRIATES